MSGFFDQQFSQENEEQKSTSKDTEADTGAVANPLDAQSLENERTDTRLRDAVKDLLKNGLIEAEAKPNLYRTATVEHAALVSILEPMDLTAVVDDVRGLVYLAVLTAEQEMSEEGEDWSHTLVRKQRLTLEQSLLVAILRQAYVAHEQDVGVGGAAPVLAVDDITAQLQLYLGESGSEQKDRTRAFQLLDQLKGYGLVTAPDSHDRVTIRPIITHLANPENLKALQSALKARLSDEEAKEEGSSQ
ncbi:MAG: DUF4194 domain-containing protein [Reinekea sp.]